jgi:hypothetical protein
MNALLISMLKNRACKEVQRGNWTYANRLIDQLQRIGACRPDLPTDAVNMSDYMLAIIEKIRQHVVDDASTAKMLMDIYAWFADDIVLNPDVYRHMIVK